MILASGVFAIAGNIGNGRMVLRAETGEEVEKYILVINVNNVSLDIKVFASGDLEKYIDIKDKEFTLAPGEEKKAYFTIKAVKPGTTESEINIKFIPEDGNGVGLSSIITFIAKGEDKSSWFSWLSNKDEENNDDENSSASDGAGNTDDKGKVSLAIALSFTAVIFLVLVILLFIAAKKAKKSEKEIKLKKSAKRNG